MKTPNEFRLIRDPVERERMMLHRIQELQSINRDHRWFNGSLREKIARLENENDGLRARLLQK